MPKKERTFKYFSLVARKLLRLGIVVVVVNIIILEAINFKFFKGNLWIAILVGCMPFLSFLLFYLFNLPQTNYIDKLAYCKYIPWFPYYFHYTKNPRRNPQIDIDELEKKIECCDIILRRYHNYLDGIIFSENSYFTHVGICYREDDKPVQVLHATGEKGVHPSTLHDFCSCDNIALLRFSFYPTVEEGKIRTYIMEDDRSLISNPHIKDDEAKLYDYLIVQTKTNIENATFHDGSFNTHYRKIIADRALSLVDYEYDFEFNFDDFATFSCIEYVWYCFKCLFPVHRIRVKDFEFFNWIKMPVIIPDVFIKNDYFKYEYSSLPNISSKEDLKKFIKKGRKEFWVFLLSMFIWSIILLLLIHFATTF